MVGSIVVIWYRIHFPAFSRTNIHLITWWGQYETTPVYIIEIHPSFFEMTIIVFISFVFAPSVPEIGRYVLYQQSRYYHTYVEWGVVCTKCASQIGGLILNGNSVKTVNCYGKKIIHEIIMVIHTKVVLFTKAFSTSSIFRPFYIWAGFEIPELKQFIHNYFGLYIL